MKLTLTNNSTAPLPIMSNDEGGWVDVLQPSQAYSLDRPSDVVILGNKPSVTEQIMQGLQTLAATVRAILTAWQNHNNAAPMAAEAMVQVTIENTGAKAVRVILGDGVTDEDVQPGARYEAEAWGYIELRELGDVQVDPNQHEAA